MKIESAYELKQQAKVLVSRLSTSEEAEARHRLGRAAWLASESGGSHQPVDGEAPAIVGLGISRTSGGLEGYRLAVRYRQASNKQTIDTLRQLEELAKGEVDAQETGDIRLANWHQMPQRPCRMGTSISVDGVRVAGTLGAFVQQADDEALYLLSNNHVLTNEQTARHGTSILQPGGYDGGTSADRVGELSDWVTVAVQPGNTNGVDAAIARVDAGIDADRTYLANLGRLAGTSDAEARNAAGETIGVHKLGRTTGKTSGVVTAANIDVVLRFAGYLVTFENQMELAGESGAFGAQGDSGALVVDQALNGIGLLFAVGDNGNGYANHINPVLDSLQLKLAI